MAKNLQQEFDCAIREYEGAQGGYKKGEYHYDRYLTNEAWQGFLREMERSYKHAFSQYSLGGGSELKDGRNPPKMACFGSSSRLIYRLSRDICSFSFEKQLPTTINGGEANLDGWLSTEKYQVFVEAKCREIYGSISSERSAAYTELLEYINEKSRAVGWSLSNVYCDKNGRRKICCKPIYKGEEIKRLDLMQLMCHMLGIGNGLLSGSLEFKPVRFLYLLCNPRRYTKNEKILEIYKEACLEEERLEKEYGKELYGIIIDFLLTRQGVKNLSGRSKEEIKDSFLIEAVDEDAYIERLKEYMEARFYTVTKIEGEYAYIREEKTGEEIFIAMFLLPENIDIGTKLKYEMLEYEVVEK